MRDCPANPAVSVQDKCEHTSCLSHDRSAKFNCLAQHIKRTDITVSDIAYVHEQSVRTTRSQIDAGLKIVAAYVSLLREADDLNGSFGCPICGHPGQHTLAQCEKGAKRIAKISAVVPLNESVGHISSAIWYKLINHPRSKLHDCYQLLKETDT